MGLYGQAVAVIGAYEVQLVGEVLVVDRLPDKDVTQLPLPCCATPEQVWEGAPGEVLKGGDSA